MDRHRHVQQPAFWIESASLLHSSNVQLLPETNLAPRHCPPVNQSHHRSTLQNKYLSSAKPIRMQQALRQARLLRKERQAALQRTHARPQPEIQAVPTRISRLIRPVPKAEARIEASASMQKRQQSKAWKQARSKFADEKREFCAA